MLLCDMLYFPFYFLSFQKKLLLLQGEKKNPYNMLSGSQRVRVCTCTAR